MACETASTSTTTAPGSTDLAEMLRTLSTTVTGPTYVFCTFKPDESIPSGLPVKMRFEEEEGTTIITPQVDAERLQIKNFFFPCRCVSLTVHSSLEAVGLLAAVTSHLAQDLKIGVNPVSGFHHDHLFVAVGTEEMVVNSLKELARKNGSPQ